MAGPMLPGYGESASFAKQKIDHSPKRPLQNPFADREHLRLLISKLQSVFSRLPDLGKIQYPECSKPRFFLPDLLFQADTPCRLLHQAKSAGTRICDGRLSSFRPIAAGRIADRLRFTLPSPRYRRASCLLHPDILNFKSHFIRCGQFFSIFVDPEKEFRQPVSGDFRNRPYFSAPHPIFQGNRMKPFSGIRIRHFFFPVIFNPQSNHRAVDSVTVCPDPKTDLIKVPKIGSSQFQRYCIIPKGCINSVRILCLRPGRFSAICPNPQNAIRNLRLSLAVTPYFFGTAIPKDDLPFYLLFQKPRFHRPFFFYPQRKMHIQTPLQFFPQKSIHEILPSPFNTLTASIRRISYTLF